MSSRAVHSMVESPSLEARMGELEKLKDRIRSTKNGQSGRSGPHDDVCLFIKKLLMQSE